MKIILKLYIVLLFISCNKSSTTIMTRQGKTNILISLKVKGYSGFDIPTMSLDVEHIIMINQGETLVLDFEQCKNCNLKITSFEKQKISFEFKEDNYKVTGYLFIPMFNELRYIYVYDVVTALPVKLTPFYYRRPIRTGTWTYENQGIITKETYNIVIDEKYIKK